MSKPVGPSRWKGNIKPKKGDTITEVRVRTVQAQIRGNVLTWREVDGHTRHTQLGEN